MSGEEQSVVRVGPAGWSYPDWKGIVYPPGMASKVHRLSYISNFFDTIEINTSFYHPPTAKITAQWVQRVAGNPRFRFTAKLWERFTHQRDSWPEPHEIQTVHDGMAPVALAGKLGALLAQFPWSCKRTRENRIWLARVLDTFAAYPLALEVRHASWDAPEVYAGLAARNVAFCNIDQPQFHRSLGPTVAVTAPVGYVRLHGRNHDDWFREDADRNDRYNYLYSEEELAPWLEKIKRMRRLVDEVFVITNNHYEGQAVVNAFELQRGLGKTDFILPRHLVDHYPRLKHLTPAPPCEVQE